MSLGAETSGVPRWLLVASGWMFWALIAAGVAVGAYAIANPNGIHFGAPWPVISEMTAALAALILGLGVRARERRGDPAVLALGIAVACVALLMLAFVAFGLSFNET
jgi:peptidoglycan/LPS O-acetylase OafA/YrhL